MSELLYDLGGSLAGHFMLVDDYSLLSMTARIITINMSMNGRSLTNVTSFSRQSHFLGFLVIKVVWKIRT